MLVLVTPLLTAPSLAAGSIVSYGAADAPEIILMLSMSPNNVDVTGVPHRALGQWLALLADGARVRLTIRPVTDKERLDDLMRNPDTCSLNYARLPVREKNVNWLYKMKRDRIVFVTRANDPFNGRLADLLSVASGQVGAPSGIYRTILDSRGIRHIVVDDHRQLAQMVDAGHPRFGLMLDSSLSAPEIKALKLRVVAELPEVGFWLACSHAMPLDVRLRISTVLYTPAAQRLHREATSARTAAADAEP
ncbi:hypothetical protein CHU95_18145 [Niveispirillum lacus]|uniref:Solute-binding protein family 3/N-terminal domain-containing protein n=1 Tax=Niveispirillum lacus TaxID=1981099 RepID=A0A255YTW6_9PROT|nr:hypothetical protein CHU95_18145 [Niveispirillum lacus]